ncbi:VanZ family protein [Thermodesulfatator autotrophicus]|uniref:VanZ-like domain-containing protein n=1 Tax=Thermodesulfatator autotrophicus TaxID=1795632 RepID=A0A177E6U6_9BACT|nr:VanZ family protein [Thermodesulfatator autotrophicus]OAG27683.1 hypothetical protein TH606_05670 [Thermodesulfatator autotrophicus]
MNRKTATLFLLISLPIIVYLTLYPFVFSEKISELELEIFFSSRKHHSLPDIFSNFLLFFPVGYFWFYAARVRNKWLSGVTLLFFASIFSFTLEFFQQFLPERIATLIDVASNTLGAIAGFLVAPFLTLPKNSRFSLDEYFAMFMAFYLLCEPFLPSLDIGDLKHKIKTLSWDFSFTNIFLSSFFISYAFKRFSWTYLLLFWSLLEGFRFLVVSIVINPVKSFLRLVLANFFITFFKRRGFYIWTFALSYLLEAWAPFLWRHPSFKMEALIPFKYFYDNVSFAAIFSLFRELFCFVFWGLIQGSLVGAILLSFIAEVGQLFIVSRYADATTIFLAVLGTLLGKSLLAPPNKIKLK